MWAKCSALMTNGLFTGFAEVIKWVSMMDTIFLWLLTSISTEIRFLHNCIKIKIKGDINYWQ